MFAMEWNQGYNVDKLIGSLFIHRIIYDEISGDLKSFKNIKSLEEVQL